MPNIVCNVKSPEVKWHNGTKGQPGHHYFTCRLEMVGDEHPHEMAARFGDLVGQRCVATVQPEQLTMDNAG
jgi:hypothetical protein